MVTAPKKPPYGSATSNSTQVKTTPLRIDSHRPECLQVACQNKPRQRSVRRPLERPLARSVGHGADGRCRARASARLPLAGSAHVVFTVH
ncbi:hypothetical protein EVAR_66036_1 [Eumeta japonica]|uniref:Uncharacterized protein n=1 Tax=Eumeta variegata TaxID=151549 RepID=A0A4C1Z6I7_EUMVA|nr:hypothetical protein EVAR_66036_1 [Eumeta japonica]